VAIILDVNMDDVVVFSNKLEKLNKTAFPNAVKTALNSAAFKVKKETLLAEASKTFEKRQPNFFRANSRVKMVSGMNVNNMESMVGMIDLKGNNHAVKDLEQQEHGGRIGGKSFIPLKTARTSKKYEKRVSKKNRIGTIRNVVDSRSVPGRSTKQKFVRSIHSAGNGGHVLHNGILWRVESTVRKRNGMFKIKPLYSYKRGRSISVKATHFMEKATMASAKDMDKFFIKAAKTQFNKALK
jgi:hypothetical protein